MMPRAGLPHYLTKSLKFSVIVAFIVVVVACSHSGEAENIKAKILYKCSASVKEGFLTIPTNLRTHKAKFKHLGQFSHSQKKYGADMYNFTLALVDSDLDHDPGPDKIKSLCKDIRANDREDLDAVVANGSYLQLSLTDGLNRRGVESERFTFNPNGFLTRDWGASQIMYDPLSFCVARVDHAKLWIRVCSESCSFAKDWGNSNSSSKSNVEVQRNSLCVPKCCPFGQVHQISSSGQLSCRPVYDPQWTPNFGLQNQNKEPVINYQFTQVFWNNSNFSELRVQKAGLKILSTEEIYYRNTCDKWRLLDLTSLLCMEEIWTAGVDHTENDPRGGYHIVFGANEAESVAPLSFYPKVQFLVYLISSLIDVVTLAVFIALWSHQNVHGFTTMIFVLAQFLLEFFQFLVQTFNIFYPEEYQQRKSCRLINLCIAMGALEQFFFIHCFSWTTVLAFDIFSTIRFIKRVIPFKNKKNRGWTRFGLYSIFGVGVPLIWTAAALLVDRYSEPMDKHILRPGFSDNCFIARGLAVHVYLVLPTVLLAAANLVLTYYTVKFVWESKRNISRIKDSVSSKDDHDIILVAKLCVMMGIFLLFHVLYVFGNPVTLISKYLVFLELHWILLACGTFKICVWNEPTLRQLGASYPILSKLAKKTKGQTATALSSINTN